MLTRRFFKLKISLLLLALFLCLQAPIAKATATLARTLLRPANNIGIIGWWTFDGKNMTQNVSDTSGSNNPGFLSGFTSTTTAAGKFGQALSFDGVDDQVQMGLVSSSVTNISLSAWVYLASYSAGGQVPLIFSNGTAGANGFALTISDGACGHGTTVTLSLPTVTCNAFSSGTYTILPNVWTHLVLTRGASTWNLYANGVQVSSGTASPVTPTAASHIGGSTGSDQLNGRIDDMRFYSREFSATEVGSMEDAGTSSKISVTKTGGDNLANGIVGWWTFDGKSMIQNVSDTSGQGKNGMIVGQTSTTTAPGKLGQAILLDGIDDYVSVGASFNGVQAVSFWAKVSTSTASQDLLNLNGGNANVSLSSGTITAGAGFTSPTIYVDGAVSSTLNDLKWHLVTVVSTAGINANSVTLGKSTNYFGGVLDDVRFYSKTLPAAQVATLYQTGSGNRLHVAQIPVTGVTTLIDKTAFATTTLAIGVNSITYTLPSSFDTSRSVVINLGLNVNDATERADQYASMYLTDANTVTITRGTSANDAIIPAFEVVQFSTGVVSSIQTGDLVFTSGNSTQTKTITSVDTSRSVVLWQGNYTTNGTTIEGRTNTIFSLSDSTTVTGNRGTSGAVATSTYAVIQFASGITTSVQQASSTISASTPRSTFTINAVNMNNAFLFFSGYTYVAGGHVPSTAILADSTTVVFDRGINQSGNSKAGGTVVEFSPTYLNSNAQSGSTLMSGKASDISTLTSVTLNKTLLSWTGARGDNSLPSRVRMYIYPQSSTNITAYRQSSSGNASTTWSLIESK